MKRLALVDGDIILAKSAYAAERTVIKEVDGKEVRVKEITSEQDVIWNVDSHMKKLHDNLGDIETLVFIGGEGNFRKRIDPEYKGNRDPQDKPILFDVARDYMTQLGAISVPYIEVDDVLSIIQHKSLEKYTNIEDHNTVICSIDKDLNTVPGAHYNIDHAVEYWVTEEEAMYSLFLQVLTGDSSDNIKGIKGIGPKKAAKLLDPEYPDEIGMWEVIKDTYQEKMEDNWEEIMYKNLSLLSMLVYIPHDFVFTQEEEDEINGYIDDICAEYGELL